MQYVDEKGKIYEISYSQKLQKEQNRLHRQKNILLFCLLIVMLCFGMGALYLYFRLTSIDFLTKLMAVLSNAAAGKLF